MARVINHQLKLLCLLEYLLENTDSEHTAKTMDIVNHLKENGYSSERRSLYDNIDMLNDYFRREDTAFLNAEYKQQDYERLKYIANKNHKHGYSIPFRDFTLEELQIMVDGVQSIKLITQERADAIIRKIGFLTSKHQLKLLNRSNGAITHFRTRNKDTYKNSDTIQRAIDNDCMIEFYFIKRYSRRKPVCNKKVLTVSPYALLWKNNDYCLLCVFRNEIRYFRVDKMLDISILADDRRRGSDIFEKMQTDNRKATLFSLRYDKVERVKLRFQNDLKDIVLECFEYDGEPMKEDATHLSIYTYVDITSKFFGWLCSYGKSVAVVEPKHVVDQFGEYISRISQMYKIEKSIREKQGERSPT